VNWVAFEHDGKIYDLDHLASYEKKFERAAKDGKPATVFTVDVTFSLHCFAREVPASESYDKALEYSDARETRLFDFGRYEQSKRLPVIIETLAERKCLQTGHSNFLTIDYFNEDGNKTEYDIFFAVTKSSRRGRLNLFIQSAYIRNDPKNRPPSGKPIGFLTILHNILNGKPIRS
jgi:hypothetical protein